MSIGIGASIAGGVLFLVFIGVCVIFLIIAAVLFWPKKKKPEPGFAEPVVASVVPQEVCYPSYDYTPRNPRLDAIDYEVAVAAEALREIKRGEYKTEVIESAKASFAKA